jgi:hypothetical protein
MARQQGCTAPRITYRLEPTENGTRLTYEHTGFSGFAGLFMSRPSAA